jgi:hypothetical protein
MRALLIAVVGSMLVAPALAERTTVTWCWAADLMAPRTCVYMREQCQDVVRLRRSGICTPSQSN